MGGGWVSATTADGLNDVKSDKSRSSSASCCWEGLGGAGGKGSCLNCEGERGREREGGSEGES